MRKYREDRKSNRGRFARWHPTQKSMQEWYRRVASEVSSRTFPWSWTTYRRRLRNREILGNSNRWNRWEGYV